MAWTTPKTFVAGAVLPASDLNTHLRDNLNAVIQAPSTITTTGTQTALALPGGHGDQVIFANNATLLTLQGIAAGYDGQLLTIFSIGAGQVDIANQNAGATAANRIICQITGTISLSAGSGSVALRYDATAARWRVKDHNQGAAIDYTTTSTKTGWSSFTAGRVFIKYVLDGRRVTVQFHLEGPSNSTAASFTLPFASDGSGSYPTYAAALGFTYSSGAATSTTGSLVLTPAASTVSFFVDNTENAWVNDGLTKIVTGEFYYWTT